MTVGPPACFGCWPLAVGEQRPAFAIDTSPIRRHYRLGAPRRNAPDCRRACGGGRIRRRRRRSSLAAESATRPRQVRNWCCCFDSTVAVESARMSCTFKPLRRSASASAPVATTKSGRLHDGHSGNFQSLSGRFHEQGAGMQRGHNIGFRLEDSVVGVDGRRSDRYGAGKDDVEGGDLADSLRFSGSVHSGGLPASSGDRFGRKAGLTGKSNTSSTAVVCCRGGGNPGGGYTERMRQLEQLRERQLLAEQSLESELAQASMELRLLQERNRQSVESAERELLQLTESLQESLREQHLAEAREQQVRQDAERAADEEATLGAQRERAVAELQDATQEFRELDVVFSAERCEKEKFLRALRQQRDTTEVLAADAAAAEAAKADVLAEVRALRRTVARAENCEIADAELRDRIVFKLLTTVFSVLVSGAAACRRHRARELECHRRSLAVCGRSVIRAWRLYCVACARAEAHWRKQRTLSSTAGAGEYAAASRALSLWSAAVSEARWLQHQRPRAETQRQRIVLRSAFASWLAGVRFVAAQALAPAVRRLARSLLRIWHEEAAASFWDRWVLARSSRRRRRWILLGCWRAWARRTACKLRLQRASWAMRRGAAPRHAVAALRWMLSLLERRRRLTFIKSTLSQRLVARAWRVLWASVASRRDVTEAGRRVAAAERLRLLGAAIVGLRLSASLSCMERQLTTRSLRRQRLEVARLWVLPFWRAVATTERGQRCRQQAAVRTCASRRLWQWQRRAQKSRRLRRIARFIAISRDQKLRLLFCSTYFRWAAEAQAARRRRGRSATVAARRRISNCQAVLSSWSRVLRVRARTRRDRFREEIEDFCVHEEEMGEALQAIRDANQSSELRRLRLIDELHATAEEAAACSVGYQEALDAGSTLQRAAAAESVKIERLESEATALRLENQAEAGRRAARHATLEDEVARALAEPARLRAELREGEEAARAAAIEENEAQLSVNALCEELEELHQTGSARVKEREEEVALLHNEVHSALRAEQQTRAALAQQESSLQRQELRVQQLRQEDTERDLAMAFPNGIWSRSDQLRSRP
eukprot:TRINITY_DN48750_c0_g1_i1.p1 TRINITY_DN48750_c0_g1~~TRINITY_DN48750_c0_g1_i1.p1  ORF type:complete len:1061 (+),score=197.55 TRINITY_DN48750_c0_g1_i1:150-3332(+)